MVERGPEKAGVGGSIPSLATILFNNFNETKKRVRLSCANKYAYIGSTSFDFWRRSFKHAAPDLHIAGRRVELRSVLIVFYDGPE